MQPSGKSRPRYRAEKLIKKQQRKNFLQTKDDLVTLISYRRQLNVQNRQQRNEGKEAESRNERRLRDVFCTGGYLDRK